MPTSSTPSPSHRMTLFTFWKAVSTSSRTLCVSPVAMTISSGLSCWSIIHIACKFKTITQFIFFCQAAVGCKRLAKKRVKQHQWLTSVGFCSFFLFLFSFFFVISHWNYLNVVFGVPPISSGIQITQFKALHVTESNFGNGACDLARDETLPAVRALVVEQNTVAEEHVVRFSVVADHPVTEQLRNSLGNDSQQTQF